MSSITTFLFFVSLLIVSLSLPPINREDIVLKEETSLYATKVMKARVLESEETTTYVDGGSSATIPTTPAPPKLPAEKTTFIDETTPVPEEATTYGDDEHVLQTTLAPTKPTTPTTPTPLTPTPPTPTPSIPSTTSTPTPTPIPIPIPIPTTPTTLKPPPSPSATPAPEPTHPAPQPPKSESSGGGSSIGAIIGAAAAIILLILCSSIVVVWIVLREKKKSTKATKTKPTETPAAEDEDVYPKTILGTTVNPELQPYHIPPDKFTYKGPVVLHNAMLAGPKEHRFAQQKSKSIKAVEWDDAANEAYEIGSEIEQIQDVAPEDMISTKSKSEDMNALEETAPLEIAPPTPPTNTATQSHRTKQGKTTLKKTRKPTSKAENKRLKKPSFGPRKKRHTTDQ